jgi:endoglucanase
MTATHRYALPMFSLKALSLVALLAIEMPFAARGANLAKMAAAARFDLSSTNVNLSGAAVLGGSGQIERMGWVQGEAKNRGYTANFSISPYAWSELKIRFIPEASGIVQLKLMGPYEAAPGGELYQEEVLWDKLSAEGASIKNGSFEEKSSDWSGGLIETGNLAPDGTSYARTWHNRTLATPFQVRKAEPVTLTLFARAQLPDGFREMRRLSSNSRAFTAAAKFRRGANLGNYLEAPPGQDWGMHYSREDFVNIRKEGFDHVRIPVGWHHYTSGAPDFKLKPEIFAKVDFLVTNALAEGLNVIVNIHHFDAFTSNPESQRARFDALWQQIAAHYKDASEAVAFELLNEPKDKATTPVLNPIFAETIQLIRRTNPTRTIFLGPGKWNSIDELPSLQLPDDDENLIVTVHCYDPFYFTHQGATWSGPDTAVRGIIFPGPPAKPLIPDFSLELKAGVLDWIQRYNSQPAENNPSGPKAFRPKLKRAGEWSAFYGRPVHVGEFGAFVGADPQSRANFYREFRKALDEFDLGWALWDWKAGFKYWDGQANGPAPGMREALFGSKGR